MWEASVQYICGVFRLSSQSTSSVALTVADRLSAPGVGKMKNRGIYKRGGTLEQYVMLCVCALFDCFCCFSEVSIERVLFSTVLARRVLEEKDV